MRKYHIPDPFLVEIGERMRTIRKSKRITLRQLSQMCGIDFGHLSRLENGRKNSCLLTLKKVADKLEVNLEDLIIGKN